MVTTPTWMQLPQRALFTMGAISLAAMSSYGAYRLVRRIRGKSTTTTTANTTNNSSVKATTTTSLKNDNVEEMDAYKDWITFSNDLIKFKYPRDANFTVKESNGMLGLTETTCIVLKEETFIQIYFALERIAISPVDVKEYVKNALDLKPGYQIQSESDVQISGCKGYLVEIANELTQSHSIQIAVCSKSSGLLFHLIFGGEDEEYKSYRELFMKISSTVKLK